jgi:hypothetical protein
VSDPGVGPVPESGIVRLGTDPLVRIVTVPVAALLDVAGKLDGGVKVTLKVAV